MTDESFAKKLQALTGALPRPDPTPDWKADILARARREADAFHFRSLSPPRWLLLGWAACWLFTIMLRAMTPAEPRPSDTIGLSASLPAGIETDPLTGHKEALLTMLAQNESSFPAAHP